MARSRQALLRRRRPSARSSPALAFPACGPCGQPRATFLYPHRAAMALETCEAAGSHAERLMLYLCAPERYRRAGDRTRRGALAAKRDPAAVREEMSSVPTFVHDGDPPVARQAARVSRAGMHVFMPHGYVTVRGEGVRRGDGGRPQGDRRRRRRARRPGPRYRLLDAVLLAGLPDGAASDWAALSGGMDLGNCSGPQRVGRPQPGRGRRSRSRRGASASPSVLEAELLCLALVPRHLGLVLPDENRHPPEEREPAGRPSTGAKTTRRRRRSAPAPPRRERARPRRVEAWPGAAGGRPPSSVRCCGSARRRGRARHRRLAPRSAVARARPTAGSRRLPRGWPESRCGAAARVPSGGRRDARGEHQDEQHGAAPVRGP